MPTDYGCSACGLKISTGSYHGSGAEWYNLLYCRHCFTRYRLEQHGRQFFDGSFGASELEQHEYVIRGPAAKQHVILSAESPATALKCESCGVEGPFGASGPLTDDPPPGFPEHSMPEMLYKSGWSVLCPRCKEALKVTGWWIA